MLKSSNALRDEDWFELVYAKGETEGIRRNYVIAPSTSISKASDLIRSYLLEVVTRPMKASILTRYACPFAPEARISSDELDLPVMIA
jgi:hypothetical protein